jgi:hypothetical protein
VSLGLGVRHYFLLPVLARAEGRPPWFREWANESPERPFASVGQYLNLDLFD